MKKIKLIGSLISLLLSLPIWYYLLFKVLDAVNASELMWFLFWIYVPIGFLAAWINLYFSNDKP